MGSHNVTCHPTQSNTPRLLTPASEGWYTRFTYPRGMEDWVDLGDWCAKTHRWSDKTHDICTKTRWDLSPPSVSNKDTKCGWYLARTLMNDLKSWTLRRVRKSSNLSFRSRDCGMVRMWSLCDHVMNPRAGLASSLMNASLESMRSIRWTPLWLSVRIRTSSRGRMSAYSGPMSADNKLNDTSCWTHNEFYFNIIWGTNTAAAWCRLW